MTERYCESQVGAIHYEVSEDTRQLIYKQRNRKLAVVGGAMDELTAKLSPVAEAMASIAPLASASKELATCMVAEKYLQWKPMPESVEREEIKIPVFDYQAVVDRHREHERRETIETARLAEFARLRARDEYEASKQSALRTATPAPVLALVASGGNLLRATNEGAPLIQPEWKLREPKRYQGYARALFLVLKAAHSAGKSCPRPRDVLDSFVKNKPSEVIVVNHDGFAHYDAYGNSKDVSLESLAEAIRRMTA